MRVTSRGQVTIPVTVREALGIQAGTEVEFALEDGRAQLRPAGGRGRRLVERMRGRGTVDVTTDQVMALTRGEA